jgi:hypothetical protein
MLSHCWISPPDTGSASWRSPVAGRLRGHVSPDIDPFAPFEFQLAATELFRAEVEPFCGVVIGNEALAHPAAAGRPVRTTQPWAKLYGLRNHLPVIDFPTSMTGESDTSRG